jgi:hypothetical protein
MGGADDKKRRDNKTGDANGHVPSAFHLGMIGET